jgi:transposase
MGRQLKVEWHHTRKRLFILYRRETDLQHRTRLQALMLLRQGKMLAEVADIVGLDYRSVQRWVAWYRAGGVEEVQKHHLGGHGHPARRLSPEQEAALKAKAVSGEVRSVWDGVHWAEAVGVVYTYWGMRWVFERLALKKKVPRPSNPKASPEQQAAWKKGGSRKAYKKRG